MLPFNAFTSSLATSPIYSSTSSALPPAQQQQQQQQLFSEPPQLATPPTTMATPTVLPPAAPPVLTVYRPVFKEVTGTTQFDECSAKRMKLGSVSKCSVQTQHVVLEPISVPILPSMSMEDISGLVRMSEYNRELVSVLMLSQEKVTNMEREQLQRRILALQAPIMAPISAANAGQLPLSFSAAPMAPKPAAKYSPIANPPSVMSPEPVAKPAAKPLAAKPEIEIAGITIKSASNSVSASTSHTTSHTASHTASVRPPVKNGHECRHNMPWQSRTEQKHYVWRLYIKGLVTYTADKARDFLRHYEIEDLDIFHFNFCASDVCEFIVLESDAPRVVRRMRRRGKIILEGFDPLVCRSSKDEWRWVSRKERDEYAKCLLASYSKSSSRDFRRYIQTYARDIGLGLLFDDI